MLSRPGSQEPCSTCMPVRGSSYTADPRGFTPRLGRLGSPLPPQRRDFLFLGLFLFAWFSTIELVAFHWAQQSGFSVG